MRLSSIECIFCHCCDRTQTLKLLQTLKFRCACQAARNNQFLLLLHSACKLHVPVVSSRHLLNLEELTKEVPVLSFSEVTVVEFASEAIEA